MGNTSLQPFGGPHIVAIALTAALPVLLSWIARRASSETAATIGKVLACTLVINEVVHWCYRIGELGWIQFAENHLPLQLCGISVLAIALALLSRRQRIYEIAFFWGLVGASNAVITPSELGTAFPQYRFFQYFIAHSGIVIGVLFATFSLNLRPTVGGMFRAFAWLNVLALVVGCVNALLGSNYMYLSRAPTDTLSPFFFLPWPWYIPVLEVIGLAMGLIVLAPFALADRHSSSSSDCHESTCH